ncbi:DUF2291 family protein [Rhizobium sp. CC-YZS058]|uniref:DUF2291 family protein n=1 Tax=Rhizobium sp. CC-YZS058 TaxID=3042153 RepID=UPI002B052F64|nr:DUF2291 family protein [Rhizobium sp. CC-YZS058]MEA3534572.1 DUF2291 family protein [Rhizobium sp. CC-YZS058]
MSTVTTRKIPRQAPASRRGLIAGVAGIVLLAAMAYDTRIVQIGSEHDVRQAVFSPEAFGAENFPKIKADVEKRAVAAPELAAAIAADKKAAAEKYGVATSTGPVFPVSFTATAGERKGNAHVFSGGELPADVVVRVQTGPAVNGTDLRDATGAIEFGQFTNQIEYQNAGSAINNQMKKDVLANAGADSLTGKTAKVVGVFKLINPKSWLITPVRLDVQ